MNGPPYRKLRNELRRETIRSWCAPILCACLAGCEGSASGPGAVSPDRTTYVQYCAGCHGSEGDGRGPAARFLLEPPRDFTRAIFKFKSTPGGKLPSDEDLLRVIDRGLLGTAMPAFSLLAPARKAALLATIKGFSPRWGEPEWRDTPVAIPPDPFAASAARTEEALRRGESIYHGRAQCASCHPVYLPPARREEFERAHGVLFRKDGAGDSVVKRAGDGRWIRPPDFRLDPLKSVEDLRDLYRVIALGVGGTEMPTWSGVLADDEIWALAHYVDSVVRVGEEARAARRQRIRAEARRTR